MTNLNTTTRSSTTSLQTMIRNVNNRIALLTLRKILMIHTPADLEEIEQLRKKLENLNREYYDAQKWQKETQA